MYVSSYVCVCVFMRMDGGVLSRIQCNAEGYRSV